MNDSSTRLASSNNPAPATAGDGPPPEPVTDSSKQPAHDDSPGRFLADLGLSALPGFLTGTQTAGLLFFLNPDLPFGLWPFFRAALFLGLPLGLLSAGLLSVISWRRRSRRAPRLLPWALTLVLAAAAFADGLHAWYFAFFVPQGMNVRLIKAAVWLAAAALIMFYTTLLHSFPPKPYSRRSVIALILVTAASIYILLERREAFRPRVPAAPLPSAVALKPGPDLIVVGIQGATLDAILPLAEQGLLPFWSELMSQGTYARLASLSPPEASALWTTVATGRPPHKHGVLGEEVATVNFLGAADLRLLPGGPFFPRHLFAGLATRGYDAALRKSAALWEVESLFGRPSGVVAWPVIHPTRQALSFAFSDSYFGGDFSTSAALPPELAERGVFFQVGVAELDQETVAELGAELPSAALRMLAGDVWRESLSLFLLDQRQELRSFHILLPGLSEVSRRYFGGYAAAQFDGSQDAATREAAQIVTAYYRHLDSFLARLWARWEGPKVFAVVSPFGIEAPTGWRKLLRGLMRRSMHGVFHPTSDGALFLRGDGIRQDQFLTEAHILDVAPTLLYAAGHPISRELEGTVLVSAFDPGFVARTPLTFVPSYESTAALAETPAN